MNLSTKGMKRPAGIGMLTAVIVFFLGMLINAQLRADSSELGTSLLAFAAFAVPGGLLAWWLGAVGVDNLTDTGATLYTGLARSGITEFVPARTGLSWGAYRPNSVRFG
ncbi:hypothetical protein ACFXKR_40625 [Streptomyces violascens]|uniref:hypothetical protein n=1 Tax=Streptomyces violascens TaxID=67381 RepID=UPI0036CA7A13